MEVNKHFANRKNKRSVIGRSILPLFSTAKIIINIYVYILFESLLNFLFKTLYFICKSLQFLAPTLTKQTSITFSLLSSNENSRFFISLAFISSVICANLPQENQIHYEVNATNPF